MLKIGIITGSTHPNRKSLEIANELKIWTEKIASLDGFIFVVPEYNHGLPSVLKNAIDYLYPEYTNKTADIVSYG